MEKTLHSLYESRVNNYLKESEIELIEELVELIRGRRAARLVNN